MKKAIRRLALVPVVLASLAILLSAGLWSCTPRLARYDPMRFPEDTVAAGTGVRVTFLGVSTLLIEDDTSSFITDAFFTRPGYLGVLRHLSPDREEIRQVLDSLNRPDGKRLERVRAVVALHSHYDHVMDAPYVADTLGVDLIGSRSTQMVARSYGMPRASRFDPVSAGDSVQLGGFRVSFVECVHGPPDRFPGIVDTLLDTATVKKEHFRTGNCFVLLVKHGTGTILVTGTAGFVPGALEGLRADVVYLSVGGLGEQDATYRAGYWREVVQTTGARRVVLIHWDNLLRSLLKPLTPVPRTPLKDYSDRLPITIEHLCALAARDSVDLRLAREWVAGNPFDSLPSDPRIRVPRPCPEL